MIPAPRILTTWREALATRCENALILGVLTRRDALDILAYVKALEEELEQERRKVAWGDRALYEGDES